MTKTAGDDHAKRVQLSSPPPSSFPISSPTFWTEAAVTVDDSVDRGPRDDDGKRPAEDGDGADMHFKDVASPDGAGPYHRAAKKARFLAPSETPVGDGDPEVEPPSSPIRKLKPSVDGEGDDVGSRTALSYLPNRLDPHLFDATNAYLASAEYAPNKFGDIGDYMRKKEVKVQTQNRDIAMANADPNIPQIFKDQSFWINGNTHPPMEELRKMILQRGGEVRPKLWNKGYVKFIIAPMLTQMKFKEFRNYKVVKEGWIVESCKAGKLLDWTRWKLQVQGGWEETGRKGLEGFLRGEGSQSQRVSSVKLDNDDSEEDEEEQAAVEVRKAIGTETTSPLSRPPDPVVDTAPRHINSAATQSLIRSPSATGRVTPVPIPISPGFRRAATAAAEGLPAKVHRPEGAWEHYYTKDSNEHAAEALKNSEWRVRNTAERGNEGGFIDGYYQNSRLHHLSTWKAELKVLVAAAQKQSEENSLSRPSHSTVDPYSLSTAQLPKNVAPQTSSTAGSGDKVIFHVDFDCFFVSCGLATRPHLRGLPSVVCHSQLGKTASTSEIASASYEARAKGVKNGMSLGRAKQLVGDSLQTIPYEFDTYKKFSLSFYTVLMGYADELQAVSVDEALIDVTNAVRAREMAPEEALDESFDGDDGMDADAVRTRGNRPRNAAVEIAEKIRDDVRKLTDGCEVSIGIAHNILLAKLATRAAKPAGVYHLRPAVVPNFLQDLDVKDLPSIGYSTANKIEEKFGTTKCGALLEIAKPALQKTLGPKTGEMVFGYLRGQDDRKLEPHKERKSISAEMNYGIRFRNQDQADVCIRDLAAEVAKRLKQNNVRGRLLTLKLMSRHPDAPVEPPKFLGHGWCETFNKSATIGNKGGSATDDPTILGTESVKLLRAMKLDPVELRGVGIQITRLEGEVGKPVGGAEREAGQVLLSFAAKEKDKGKGFAAQAETIAPPRPIEAKPSHSRSRSRSLSRTMSPEPAPQIASIAPVAGPSRLAAAASSDGIDPDFLAALPVELRQEVKRDHAITRARARERAESERPETNPKDALTSRQDERATTISPAKSKGMHKAAHITKQLRPRVKTQLKAAAISDLPLYGAWNKAQQQENEEDDDEIVVLPRPDRPVGDENDKIGNYFARDLRELGIDPNFLRDLPEEMQKEVVDAETARRRQRQLLHRPADTSRVQAKARERERQRAGSSVRDSASPSRTSRAGSAALPTVPAIPRITISRPTKPKLYNATTLSEVTEVITKWIDSRGSSGPAARDASKVKAYLLKCLDQSYGLGGVEMAVEVLKCMRVAIDARWEEGSCEDDIAGTQWWAIWAAFRAAVDDAHRQRFGADVRL